MIESELISGTTAERAWLVDVVVVTFNSWSSASTELLSMLELASVIDTVRWIFVDNSSHGEDAQHLRREAGSTQNVLIAERPDNPGFAGGCNYGVMLGTSKWVFFLNPDITIDRGSLERIIEKVCTPLKEESIAVSQRTRGLDHAGIGVTRYHWFTDRPTISKTKLIGPSGGAGLYLRSTYMRLGGFFEPLFAWGEDADLAMRFHAEGATCSILDLQLPHQGQHSINQTRSSRSLKASLLTRNRLLVAERNLTISRLLFFVGAHVLIITSQSIRNLRRGTFLATWSGFFNGLKILTGFKSEWKYYGQ